MATYSDATTSSPGFRQVINAIRTARQGCLKLADQIQERLLRETRGFIYWQLACTSRYPTQIGYVNSGWSYGESEDMQPHSYCMKLAFVGTDVAKEIAEVHYSKNLFHVVKEYHIPGLIKADPFGIGVNPAKFVRKMNIVIEISYWVSSLRNFKNIQSRRDVLMERCKWWAAELTHARTTCSTKKVRMPSRELERMQTAPFCPKHSPLNDDRRNNRMAQPSFSPDTSISSHTLSLGSAPPPPMELPPAAATAPTSLLANPLAFLQPTPQLNASFLAAAKKFLDPVAAGVSESQSRRQQDLRKKRKRGGGYDDDVNVLHLKKLHVDGFGVNQVFEQTRKIVEAAAEEIELSLPEQDGVVPVLDSEDEDVEEAEEYHTESEIGEEGVDWEYDGVDDDEDAEPDEDDLNDGEDIDMEDGEEGIFSDDASDEEPAETYQPDPHGLNDGFFSIDDFNKQTDFLEQQDQRGEGVDSDDDEINWEADPMEEGAKAKANGFSGDASDDESDEGGPTFGNVDLNAPEGDSGDEDDIEEGDLDGLDDGMNANNVMYKDFFAPPAQKASKNKNSKKKGRPNPHNFPEKQVEQEKEIEEDVEGTMARVHRDLFEDDDDVESEGDLSDVDPADPKSRRSTHERRQAKIAEEIRKLEAANVAKREWQLSGEARAADRPQNSLLEENLEFERAGKPVPMVTQETSEDIEALIKRRILSGEFDEIHRRRPDDLATGPRRGRVEIDDTKSGKGLAEIYEEEHLRATDPNFVEAKDEKLKKEHDEISALWKSVSAKLDSLSSSHFKPKPAAPNLEIRTDAPAIEMEDARPTAGGEVASASMLAPQEVYKPGDETGNKAEIITKSGMPVARDEMSREEKMSRRRRAKEAAKKAGLSKPKDTTAAKKTGEGKEKNRGDKKQLLGDLKKGGVQVIGRKGVLTDVEGKEVRDEVRRGAGSYKL